MEGSSYPLPLGVWEGLRFVIVALPWTFLLPVFVCNGRNAFFTSDDQKGFKLLYCQNVCDTLSYLLDNIYI